MRGEHAKRRGATSPLNHAFSLCTHPCNFCPINKPVPAMQAILIWSVSDLPTCWVSSIGGNFLDTTLITWFGNGCVTHVIYSNCYKSLQDLSSKNFCQ